MPPTDDPAQAVDKPFAEDVAELHREIQVQVNRCKASDEARDAEYAKLADMRAAVAGVSGDAVKYIDDFTNPATPEPAPIAPEVPPAVVTVETPAVNEGEGSAGGAAQPTE